MTVGDTKIAEATDKNSKPKLSWGPLTAIWFSIFIYFAAQFAGALIMLGYTHAQGWSKGRTTEWLNHSSYAQFFFVLLVEAITLLGLWWFLKGRHAKPADIGLKRPKWIDIAYALTGFGVYFLIFIVSLTALKHVFIGLNTNQKQDLGFNTSASGLALATIFVALVILPPLVEEILVRGFLYTGLRSKLPVVVAALITSVMFATAHLQFGSGTPLLWSAAIDTFTLSLVLVYLRQKTDRLWASIMLHMLKNGVAFVGLFILHLN
ncbi:MAG TPA: type II CAAX endopeptidase family protein [Candidatus Saccharimonadales bacterium]|nr:type II CAAX endopeptidase family protein [Candidatus Saccharimonadales bacterium]